MCSLEYHTKRRVFFYAISATVAAGQDFAQDLLGLGNRRGVAADPVEEDRRILDSTVLDLKSDQNLIIEYRQLL